MEKQGSISKLSSQAAFKEESDMYASINGNEIFYTTHGHGRPFPYVEENEKFVTIVSNWIANLK